MAYLKAAGKAILNSPKAIRKKFGGTSGQDQVQGHEHLEEDWYHSDDPITAGISFYVKYLGSAPVTKTHGPGSTDDAVKAIVHHAKHRGGKLQKVSITISSKFVKIKDVVKQIKLEDIPLYRVSYCTVDPYYDKVFCYISRNPETKKLECHAFLCSKKSKAEAITLTVAQAFNIAYEKWQIQKKKKEEKRSLQQQQEVLAAAHDRSNGSDAIDGSLGVALTDGETIQSKQQIPTLIEPTLETAAEGISRDTVNPKPVSMNPFSDDTNIASGSQLLSVKSTMTKAISLDYLSMNDEFDLEFTNLAEARSNPHLLDIGDHMDRSTSQEEIKEMMKEGDRSTVDDLSRSKSIDDLLF